MNDHDGAAYRRTGGVSRRSSRSVRSSFSSSKLSLMACAIKCPALTREPGLSGAAAAAATAAAAAEAASCGVTRCQAVRSRTRLTKQGAADKGGCAATAAAAAKAATAAGDLGRSAEAA